MCDGYLSIHTSTMSLGVLLRRLDIIGARREEIINAREFMRMIGVFTGRNSHMYVCMLPTLPDCGSDEAGIMAVTRQAQP